MKKLFFCFLICSSLFGQGQHPKVHLMIASDVDDAKYGVLTFGKIGKLNIIFKKVSESLNYSLEVKYWQGKNYNAEIVKSYLKDSLRKIGTNDILVFYYLGRGEKGLNNSTTELQFRNRDKKMSVSAIDEILNNKGRLAIIIADCYEPFSKSRSAFLNNSNSEITPENENFNLIELDSLETIRRKINLEKISKIELDNYELIKDSLNKILGNIALKDQSSFFISEKLLMIQKRLSEYPKIGFPEIHKSLKRKFDILPDLSMKYISNRDFSPVVDSLYKKKALLEFDDPLHVFLDTLIRIPLYDTQERTTTTVERFNDYIIRKVFFSKCGNTMVSTTSDKSTSNIDYTNSFYKNMSDLMNLTDTKVINKLEIADLLKPAKAEPLMRITNKKCPAVSDKETFYLPKIFLSGIEIESKFIEYQKTADLLLKKKLKTEILDLFVENAKITTKDKKGKIMIVELKEYLELNNKSKLIIPFQKIERVQNFSKIKTILIVEL